MEESQKEAQRLANEADAFVLEHRWDLYRECIEAWGIEAQEDMAIEETSELTKAILKHRRRPSGDTISALLEEMADAEIMLEQLRAIYDIRKDVDRIKADKLKRLFNRLAFSKHKPNPPISDPLYEAFKKRHFKG